MSPGKLHRNQFQSSILHGVFQGIKTPIVEVTGQGIKQFLGTENTLAQEQFLKVFGNFLLLHKKFQQARRTDQSLSYQNLSQFGRADRFGILLQGNPQVFSGACKSKTLPS